MKQLHIPYLPQLDDSDSRSIQSVLEQNGVRRSIDSLNWPGQFPYKPLTTFTVGHSSSMLWIDFFVRCNYLRAVNFTNQSPVSQDSCVEFFVSPHDDGRYWNFEFNCIGAVNASHRTSRPNPTRLSDEELSRIVRIPSMGHRPFEEIEGLFTWDLTVGIPLDLIGVQYSGNPVNMRGNFYKCASRCSQPHYLSWNPIDSEKPDFHRPESFGEIVLE